ncbi:TPA: bifunctional phosphopantothenoylcysteine decarboxylase/phosphopantothenate--cysteine ligase CoaBC [Streptococcus suis]
MLSGKKIGLFVTGGIAAYKMAEFSRQLIKKGATVRVVMSQAATEFISPLTLQTLTGHPVLIDTFDEKDPSVVQHIHMADWCDYVVVAPATANILAKMAHGLADDIVSTTLLAVTGPRLIVPAMNTHMYQNPATQANINKLKSYGYKVMTPAYGFLAEGYEGIGRLPDLSHILATLEALIAQHELPQVLAAKKILISAGGTKERIDPVRYISNDSSGKMGYALAQAAQYLGGQVKLVSTTDQLPLPYGVEKLSVSSAQNLYDTMTDQVGWADMVIMAAAVSDYRLAQARDQKIKKEPGQSGLQLDLIENPDILKTLGQMRRPEQVLVGFAAETHRVLEFAQAKLAKKKADWIIANDVSDQSIGFNSDENQVTLINRHGNQIALDRGNKLQVALQILMTIMEKEQDHA